MLVCEVMGEVLHRIGLGVVFEGDDVSVREKKRMLVEPNKWRERAPASSCFLFAGGEVTASARYAMMTRERHTNIELLEVQTRGSRETPLVT